MRPTPANGREGAARALRRRRAWSRARTSAHGRGHRKRLAAGFPTEHQWNLQAEGDRARGYLGTSGRLLDSCTDLPRGQARGRIGEPPRKEPARAVSGPLWPHSASSTTSHASHPRRMRTSCARGTTVSLLGATVVWAMPLAPTWAQRSPGVCSVRAARLCPSPRLAGVSAAPSRGRESALVGGVPDSIVDDAAGNQERLLRALNLESLFGGVVGPFQREASLGRLPAIRSDANPVLPAYHVLCARPLRGVDAGIGQWVTGHAPAESTKTRRLGPPSGLGWPSGTP
jgi:hypothetical protein